MARIEIDIDDTSGEITGETPEPLTALFKRTELAAHQVGFGKGRETAAADAKKQIEDTVKAEVARREAALPAEREKWAKVDEENKLLTTQLADKMRESDKLLRQREETHATQLVERAEQLGKRESRIKDLVKGQIRGFAIAAGARDESLGELEVILGQAIGFDDDMDPFVKDAEGKPALVHGKQQSLDAYVKEYMSSHPHHRKPVHGQGGGARGGATFHGAQGLTPASAEARIHSGDRSSGAINELFEATRKQRTG